jgi:hypothetical protein
MGTKKESAEKTFNLEFPTSGYRKTLFFNNFAIEEVDVGLFLGFWFLHKTGYITDEFGCFVSKVDAVRFVESFKKYVTKLGLLPNDESEGAVSGTCLKGAPVIRQIRCSRLGNVGEIDLSFFPLSAIVGQEPTDEKVKVDPVAVAMSSLQTHVNFVCRFIKALGVNS